MKITPLRDYRRHDIVNLLSGNENIGIELGVAEGIFSERMINSGRFSRFFGVDMYADSHNVDQYKRALQRVGLCKPYWLLRMRFDQAFDLFDDESLDFVYVDGYAHTGEEGGSTIFDWYRKVKIGGFIAGDDYSPDWPLVQEAVNALATQTDGEIFLTTITEAENQYCRYPSWIMQRKERRVVSAPKGLVELGRREALRVNRMAEGGILKRTAKAWCPPIVLGWGKSLLG